MNCLSWICRGFGNPCTANVLKWIIAERHPTLVFLMETKLNKGKMDAFRRRLKFDNCFTVESVGLSGGTTLLWQIEVDLCIQSFSKWHICAHFQDQRCNQTVLLIGSMGTQRPPREREVGNYYGIWSPVTIPLGFVLVTSMGLQGRVRDGVLGLSRRVK